MNTFFNIDERIEAASAKALETAKTQFDKIDEITEYNQQKVISAFIRNGVSESHFVSTTGYGYGDRAGKLLIKSGRTFSAQRMRSFAIISPVALILLQLRFSAFSVRVIRCYPLRALRMIQFIT
jgi:hypothetical protein